MGSIRIVKASNGVNWLEIDGIMLQVLDGELWVRHNGETYMLPCEVVYEDTNVIPINKGEK